MPENERTAWLRRALPGCEGRGVLIGVVDSGWDWYIEDHRVVPGTNFVSQRCDKETTRTGDTQDRIGHGTMCADLLLSIAPRATIIPLRVFGSRLETSAQTLALAIDEAAARGTDVVSISASTLRRESIQRLYVACDRAARQGVVIVAAAYGSMNLDGGPAAFAPVIGVGVGGNGVPMQFAYRPDEAIECVASVPAPMARGLGGCPKAVLMGTSAATPTIGGIVALLRERHRGASLDEIRTHLARLAPQSGEMAGGGVAQ